MPRLRSGNIEQRDVLHELEHLAVRHVAARARGAHRCPRTAIIPRLGNRSSAGRNELRMRAESQRDAPDVVGLDAQLVGLHLFGAEALDHAHTADALLDHGGQLGLFDLNGQHRRVDASREALRQARSRSATAPSAISARNGCDVNSTTTTAATIARFDAVMGIITTKPWICCRSLDARLMS